MYSIHMLQFVAFLDLLAVSLIIPLIPNHVKNMGGNHIYIGLLGSIYGGFQLGSGPFIGSLSDLKGRKPILMMTLLICSVAYVTIGFTNSILVILILRAVLGLFKQTQMLTKAMVPDYEKNERRQAEIYGKMAAISGAGITLGPVIGGHIAEDNLESGFQLIAVIVGLCFVINSGIVYFLPQSTRNLERNKHTVISANVIRTFAYNIKQSFAVLYNIDWPIYWDVFMFKALVSFALSIYYSSYSIYLKSQYDLTPKYIGYVISFQGVIGSLSCYFIGYINSFYVHDKNYSQRNFHVFLLLTLSLTGLILSYNIYFYTIWLIPLGIANGVSRLITLEMVLKRGHGEHRGTLIGASNSVRSLSGVVAPMVAGFIGQFLGVTYAIYASLFATLIGLSLCYYLEKKSVKTD